MRQRRRRSDYNKRVKLTYYLDREEYERARDISTRSAIPMTQMARTGLLAHWKIPKAIPEDR